MYTKKDRFLRFLQALGSAAPSRDAGSALALVESTLNAVEDQLTNIPFDPSRWREDGRMYPPQPDSRHDVPDRPDLVRYRTLAHSVVLRDNGAIAILAGHKKTVDDLARLPRAIDKPGADGRRVFD